LIVTSGTLLIQRQGSLATEDDATIPNFPRKSEMAALALAARGVRTSVLRLPPSVHDNGDHGFVPRLISVAREKGVSAYIGDGLNRWPAVHRLDAAHLYRLVLEKGTPGATYHGVADEGVPTRDIAEVIGRHLNVPVVSKSREEAADHFGWIARFFGMDGPASSAQTQERLGWRPVQLGLLADLNAEHYFEHATDAVLLHG
jgi:nucleoside-diphosphate-sugar epimerase